MSIFRILFLMCVLVLCGEAEEKNGGSVRQKRFITLLTNSVQIISNGIQQQSELLNQGLQNQKAIINQVPGLVQETSQAIKNSVLRAGEIPATVAAGIVLNGANAYITMTKKETVSLPEINTSVLGFGRFVATGGKLRKLSTLTQNGQVKLQKTGMSLAMEIPFKLGELNVEYENYTFRTWGINLSGNVKATVGKNGFLIRLQLLSSTDCTINVQRIELQTLEDIKVDLQGSFASFLKSATDYIATFLQGTIKSEVQKALDQQLSAYLNNNSKLICSRFTQLIP